MLNEPATPEIPQELLEDEQFAAVHARLNELRIIVAGFAKGDLSHNIGMRGFVAGGLKNLQAHLRHLTWQTQQVARGDFGQKVQFLGEFSVAFNSMIGQLDQTMKELKEKQEELTELNKNLVQEVELRVAAAIALKESEAHFKYLAEHDPLTGILNRRSFYSMLESELAKAHKIGAICCVAMLDVDRFKMFNDLYGHVEGDRALNHVVKVAQGQLRLTDRLGRFGGEEFIFFFGGADVNQGMIVAERIRKAIEMSPFTLANGQEVSMTACIGVKAVLPEWYDEMKMITHIEHYVHCADMALYTAKTDGRNLAKAAAIIKPL